MLKLGKKINIFVCGPTVYDSAHLGHARTYIVFDMISKYLKNKGHKVFYLQNITDIDDKILKRAKQAKTPWKTLARKFEKEYMKDMKTLKVDSVNKYARATTHIKEIISQIKRLEQKKFAYKLKDGIYFDISKFKNYGKLSGRTILQAEDAVSRIDQAKQKRNKGDFCLWKKSKAGEPKWKSPFGFDGRPGWHIEDTAITEKYFGPQYDIHGGGRDLMFPHHEAEIAQMEAISGKSPLVKYWLHTGFLTVDGKKMSKSLGNFVTIKDFLKKETPETLRMLIFSSHFRSPIDFSKKAILQAKKNLAKLNTFPIGKVNISKPMNNDFNTPEALAAIFKAKKWTPEIETIFGIARQDIKIPEKIKKLVQKREQVRKQKNWKQSDALRKQIATLGWQVEDTKQGPKVTIK